MLIKVTSVSFSGLNTIGIDVEVNIADNGLPCFDIVGLPNKAVAESRALPFLCAELLLILLPVMFPSTALFMISLLLLPYYRKLRVLIYLKRVSFSESSPLMVHSGIQRELF